jgi:hypothetical protein
MKVPNLLTDPRLGDLCTLKRVVEGRQDYEIGPLDRVEILKALEELIEIRSERLRVAQRHQRAAERERAIAAGRDPPPELHS